MISPITYQKAPAAAMLLGMSASHTSLEHKRSSGAPSRRRQNQFGGCSHMEVRPSGKHRVCTHSYPRALSQLCSRALHPLLHQGADASLSQPGGLDGSAVGVKKNGALHTARPSERCTRLAPKSVHPLSYLRELSPPLVPKWLRSVHINKYGFLY